MTASMVKKSVAAIAPQCAFRNVFQLVGRRPAGSIPFSARTHSLDCVSAHGVPEIGEGSLDSGVAPSRIVAGHLDDPSLDLAGDSRSARSPSRAPVVLLGDELPVPAEQYLGGDDRRELTKLSSSEGLRLSREAATLRIREAKPLPSDLLNESPILGLQILDDVLLLAADP